MHNNTKLRLLFALICWSAVIGIVNAQFQRIYGNGQDNYFTKVIPFSNYMYVLGNEDGYGTVSRISATGQLIWSYKLITPSALTDAAVDPAGNLFVTGFTLPANNTNKSLLCVFSASGGLTRLDTYDWAGFEGFVRIAWNPNNNNFLVLGSIPSNQEDVLLLRVDLTGTVTNADMYGGPGPHGFYQALEVTPSGFLMAGNNGGPGAIFYLDFALNNITAVQDPVPSIFTDLHYTANGDILAVSTSQSGGNPAVIRFDGNLFPVWTRQISGLSTIEQVVENPANGDIYLVGTGNFAGQQRAVVIKLDNTPAIQWTKYFENGETDYIAGAMALLTNNKIAFVDGREGNPNALGQLDGFIGVTGLELNSFCTDSSAVTLVDYAPLFEGPNLTYLDFTNLTPDGSTDANGTNWQVKGACQNTCPITCPKSASIAGVTNPPANCEATVDNIGLEIPDNCGLSTISYTITGATIGTGTNDASGTIFKQGISTVTYSYVEADSTLTCSFDINVECGWVTDVDFHGDIAQCGADADFFPRLGIPSSNSVLTTPVSSFPANAIVHCGKYDVYFEDLITPQQGFGDPAGNLGAIRINTLCAVLTYVQSVFDYSNVPANAPIRLYVGRSYSSINPAPSNTTYLAIAGPFYNNTNTPSLINGFAYDYITTGIDNANPNGYHAFLNVNFDQTFDVNGTPIPINWLDDYQQPMVNCYYDLYSVLLHEIGHTLGWMSLIFYNSNNHPVSTLGNDQYSGLDFTLYSGATPPFTAAAKLVTGSVSTPHINPAFVSSNTALDAIWTGPAAPPDNDPVYSGSHSFINGFGWPFAAKSILSHLDEQMWLYSTRSRISPGDVQNYVMGPFGIKGILRRLFTDVEINKLLGLGFAINSGYTSTTLTNLPPYSSKMAGYNSIFNADFPDAIPADFTISNSGSSSITINLATDPMLIDPEGDPISVFPGSLTNIRGCGNGGNNHNQLTVSGQTITYTPRPDFYGRAQFGFKLFDGTEAGSYHIYTIDVLRGTNNLAGCAPGSNLILNGDLEEGTEVKQLGANEGIDASVMEESFFREGKIRQGIHFADAQPYCYLSNEWGPYGSGEKIKDSRINCNGTTYKADAGAYQTSIPGVFSAPNSNNGTGERFKNLAGLYNYFSLCDDVQDCHRYVLEFDYYAANNIPNGTIIPITIGFTNTASYPGTPALTYSFVHNITSVATSWQHVSIPFTYCGTNPASILNIQQTTPFYLGFLVDNFSLTEDLSTPLPLTVNITPSNPTINAGSSVVLSGNVSNALCATTYNWSPLPGNTPSLVASPTTTTTYTLIVDDGCRSTTESVVVTVASDSCVIPPAGLISWWKMDDQSGSPEIKDIVGAHHATPNPGGVVGSPSGPAPVPGKVGDALHFVSPGNIHGVVGNTISHNFGAGSFSIDAWIYTDMGTQTAPIINKLGNTNNGYSFSIQGSSPYYPTLVIGKGTSVEVLQGPAIIPSDWNFVAVTVSPPSVNFYVGNSSSPTLFTSTSLITGTTNATNASQPLLIGYNPFNPHWDIIIDELEIFDRALNPLQIDSIWMADTLGKCDSLVVITGTDSGQKDISFRLYPNPNTGQFTLDWQGAPWPEGRVEIAGSLGQALRSFAVPEGASQMEVQIADLPAGMYFVKVLSEGRVVKVMKVVRL